MRNSIGRRRPSAVNSAAITSGGFGSYGLSSSGGKHAHVTAISRTGGTSASMMSIVDTSYGLCGAISGAATAQAMSTVATAKPAIATGLWRKS